MSTKKRVLVDSSSEEEIVYVISDKTRASMAVFISAINLPFWQQKDGDEPDEESSEAEIFLMKELCTTPGTLDEEKILNLLKTEDNDLRQV